MAAPRSRRRPPLWAALVHGAAASRRLRTFGAAPSGWHGRHRSEALLSASEALRLGGAAEHAAGNASAGGGAAQVGSSCLKPGAGVSRPANPLVFIHIPRNAGSSIEMCSQLDPQLPASQRWGCANENIRGLTRMPFLSGFPGYDSPWPPACYKQHVPPQYLPDIYHDKETFCIVRDPYSRMVSQFRFLMIHTAWNQQNCTADVMNQALLEDLTAAKKENPYIADCHYLPQSTFVHGINPNTAAPVFKDKKTRSCKHILRLEHLSADFEGLMSSHGYPYELHKKNRAGGTLGPKDCSHLSKQHLSPKVRALIEEVFAQDFQRFGYERS
mmetsp:Transcript_115469/g.313456  ORF Transcript_115469/g.313456 Transcript_115469/m.313456 type:complete len:328 (-) Transcript_115469:111-1094(-)